MRFTSLSGGVAGEGILVDSFCIAVAGRELLKDAQLKLMKGRRYGLVGRYVYPSLHAVMVVQSVRNTCCMTRGELSIGSHCGNLIRGVYVPRDTLAPRPYIECCTELPLWVFSTEKLSSALVFSDVITRKSS